MEPKTDVEHSETRRTDEEVDSYIPQSASKWAYLGATGLIFSYLALTEMFRMTGTLLTVINTDLGANKEYPWMFECYLFEAAILAPSLGAFADRFGRRWFLIIGNIIAIVGAIVCATAQTVNVVIIGMAFAGIGTCGQHMSIAAISELFPRKHRGIAQGVLQISVFPFVACGTLFSELLAEYSTWRWNYYLYILISGISLVLIFFLYDPPLPEHKTSTSEYLKTLDWWQPFLLTIAIFSATLGAGFVIFGIYRWPNSRVLVPLCMAPVFAVLWGYRVWTYKGPNPLFPREIFNKDLIGLLIVQDTISFPIYIGSFIWSSQVEAVYTTDPIKIGEYTLPSGFGTQVGVVMSTLLLAWRLGRTNIKITLGVFFAGLFLALQATLTPNSIRPSIAYLSLSGVASGFTLVLLPVMIQLTNPDRHIGSVSGFLISARYLGGGAAIMIGLTIIRSRVGATIIPNMAKATVPLGLSDASVPILYEALIADDVAALEQIPAISLAIIEAATAAIYGTYADAFRIIYFVSIPISVVSTVAALFLTKDVTPRMDNSLAVIHGRPWFLRRGPQKHSLANNI